VRARAVLRQLLSGYTGEPAARLSFQYAEHGKPHLPAELGRGLTFNLSHSGDLALYAVAVGLEVGVDVESTTREVAWEQVSSRFFHADEVGALGQLPQSLRRRGFFDCWTRRRPI
jgi:4'-phosphopantetheinyl transferase